MTCGTAAAPETVLEPADELRGPPEAVLEPADEVRGRLARGGCAEEFVQLTALTAGTLLTGKLIPCLETSYAGSPPLPFLAEQRFYTYMDPQSTNAVSTTSASRLRASILDARLPPKHCK